MQVFVSYFIGPLLNFTEGTTHRGEQDLSLQIVPRDRQMIQGLLPEDHIPVSLPTLFSHFHCMLTKLEAL